MRLYKLYLPAEKDQDIICQRWIHLFGEIDVQYQDVRIYVAGADFRLIDAKHPLPYAVMIDHGETKGKKKSFENMYKHILIDSGIAEDDYIPKDYDDKRP
tara:strand:+ start:627 stop:926 length:300 start_codon:yes stop_codon:yes gene_type:complete